ncbi:MAG: flagellar hook-basal body complex protein, partial [Myxococcota bacterium]
QMNFRDGILVNNQGLELMGYEAQPEGGFSSTLGPIRVGTSSLAPRATNEIEITANLDSNETAPALPFDINDPGATSNFGTSITVYDTQGNARPLDVYFTRSANPNEWEVRVVASASDVSAPAAGAPGDTNVELANATMTFDGSGRLQSLPALTAGVTFNNSDPQTLDFNLGDPIDTGGTGQLGLTQYGSPSTVGAQSQDGYAPGDLTSVDITPEGFVTGVYSNGQQVPVAQIAVARFQANDALSRLGGNLWGQTTESGTPAIGGAAAGGRAAVISGSLEQSTVDLTTQFVDMITFQRAFSANARTITTADEMLTEVVNIKR